MNSVYLCIDLKTFYASVECVQRGLDPFAAPLVVADPSRGKGAICLAVSPKMKALGVRNRCRIFEIPASITYITALPRMELYMRTAADIYGIYLRYVAPGDIHVYSIDEAFLDITPYLKLYGLSARELARRIMADVRQTTGITATAGIGTNLYLAKVALDLIAKHEPEGIGELDEASYRQRLWHHQPLSDFWQVGRGTTARLARYGIFDMQAVARCPKQLLIDEFGIGGAYLHDHANGIEPVRIADIKAYRPSARSISSNQILFHDYDFAHARLVMSEMVELSIQRLVDQHLVSDEISLSIGYSRDILPRVHRSARLGIRTDAYPLLLREFRRLFDAYVDRNAPIRSIGIGFQRVKDEAWESLNLFTDAEAVKEERQLMQAISAIRGKYGKNAVLRGMNLLDQATTRKRNTLIGGHNAR